MILAQDLRKSYGRVRAVQGLSIELPAGQIAGLLGPNGAGETTTIRMITGFLPADSGTVTVAGFDMATHARQGRRQIGYLPESAPLYPEMTPVSYLHYRGRLFGMPRRDRKAAIERVIARCRLESMRTRRIGHLSKGYRQRVGLASALLHDPPVLILDEPTNGLDPSQIRETRSLIRELAEDRTMLLCSHILPEIERSCDRVLVMAGGRMLADGTPDGLIASAPWPARSGVEIRSNPSAGSRRVLERLRRAAFVAKAELAPRQPVDAAAGWVRLIVTAQEGAPDLRESIAGWAADDDLFVRELSPLRTTLEEIFVHLVESAGMAEARRAERAAARTADTAETPEVAA